MLNVTSASRPGPYGPAATGITVAWPGHDCDCVQAQIRLVACKAAGIVTCSRLVVCKIRLLARGPMQVRLLATHAYPASDGWHMVNSSSAGWVRKLTAWETRAVAWMITAMTNVTSGTGIHSTWMRNGPLDPDKTRFIELRDTARTPLTDKLLYNLQSRSGNSSRQRRLDFN